MSNHPEQQISAYIDNELSELDRLEVENHIESCVACQGLLEELLIMQTDVSQMYNMLQAPREMDDRILQVIERGSTKRVGWFFAPIIAFIVLVTIWFMTGTVILNLLIGLLKFAVAMVYMASHFISTLPALTGLTLVLSLIILSISSYSLKRLIQTTTS